MRSKEKGVTLIALLTAVILILILASVGVTVGTSTLDSASFVKFKSELKVLQNKVNELNQSNENKIGKELTDEDELKSKLDLGVISDIIYKDVSSDEEKKKIRDGFRYFDKKCIQEDLKLDSIKRNYLINVEYRYVVFPDGFEYEGTIYYMIDQVENGFYNVRYKDKNEKTGTFDVNTTKEKNKYKIEVSNIIYNGYINNWTVKYKIIDSDSWKTSNELSFYVSEQGIYNVKVVYGDEIDLGTNTVIACDYNNVNNPKLTDKMIPVKFVEDTESENFQIVQTTSTDSQWYNYEEKRWANVQSKDGSNWVWIPRYAYKIDDTNKIIDVVFLIGTTDYYYDANGKLQKAQRATKENNYPDTNRDVYIVHPAFTDESKIEYVNGGWDKELTGIWVAKYVAGYQNSTIGEETKNVEYSKLKYTDLNGYTSNFLTASLTTNTNMSYPVFKANTYAYDLISIGDAYLLSQEIDKASMYGLSGTNSHLMKNSEWGAISYLTQSKYGVDGKNSNMNEVATNKKNLNNSVYVNNDSSTGVKANVYAVTSYGDSDKPNDVLASSTKNMTGVFDLNGCVWERTAGFYTGGAASTPQWHSAMANSNTTKSTKYVTLISENNKIGDATNETAGWNSDNATFCTSDVPTLARGAYYMAVTSGGIFAYGMSQGQGDPSCGFRVCLAF